MRPIDADEIKYPDYYYSEEASPDPFIEGFHQGKIDAICEIRALAPTIEAEPVKHGRWVYDHWCEFKCSVCGEWSKSEPYRGKENYCPNCGAKMYVTDISHKEESE